MFRKAGEEIRDIDYHNLKRIPLKKKLRDVTKSDIPEKDSVPVSFQPFNLHLPGFPHAAPYGFIAVGHSDDRAAVVGDLMVKTPAFGFFH